MAALTPEQFGAVGDRKADDTAALQAMLAEPSTTQRPRQYELRGQYKVTAPLRLASAPACSFDLDGRGGSLWWAGGSEPCLQFGDSAAGSKVYWSTVTGLRISTLGGTPGGVQVLLDDADFLTLDNVVISAAGRQVGLKSLRGNSLDFRSVHVSAAREVNADIVANVFAWRAGKVQQAPVGLRYTGTQFDIRAIDFSFLTDCAVELSAAACGSLSFYSEKIGPHTSMNSAAVIRATGSNSVTISGAILNGTWGAQSADTHCGYGVVLDNCHRFDFVATRFQRLQRAAIKPTGCQEIVVRRSCEWRYPQPGAVRVDGDGVTWESSSTCW